MLLPAPLTALGMIVMGVCNCPPETLLCNYGASPHGLNESVMSRIIITVLPDIRNPIFNLSAGWNAHVVVLVFPFVFCPARGFLS